MKKIPTAEEFLISRGCQRMTCEDVDCNYFEDVEPEDMIEFARLHVESALEEASKKAELDFTDNDGVTLNTPKVDEKSILNSYSLENIK